MSASQKPGFSSKEPPMPTDFKVYKPSLRPSPAIPNLPDSVYTVTVADLRAVQAQLTARTQALSNAPLQSRAQREAELSAKLDRWPETRIRVKFTDGTQLEKVFPSVSKIKSIYAFVRGCLREDIKPIKFILYQPPKRDFKVSDIAVRDLTLAHLQLAPSSVLLLRFEDESMNYGNIPAPLDQSVLAQAIDLPAPPSIGAEEQKKPSTSQTAWSSKEGSKVPKWLKMVQKK